MGEVGGRQGALEFQVCYASCKHHSSQLSYQHHPTGHLQGWRLKGKPSHLPGSVQGADQGNEVEVRIEHNHLNSRMNSPYIGNGIFDFFTVVTMSFSAIAMVSLEHLLTTLCNVNCIGLTYM